MTSWPWWWRIDWICRLYCSSILLLDELDVESYALGRRNRSFKLCAPAIPRVLCRTHSRCWGDSRHEYSVYSCARGP